MNRFLFITLRIVTFGIYGRKPKAPAEPTFAIGETVTNTADGSVAFTPATDETLRLVIGEANTDSTADTSGVTVTASFDPGYKLEDEPKEHDYPQFVIGRALDPELSEFIHDLKVLKTKVKSMCGDLDLKGHEAHKVLKGYSNKSCPKCRDIRKEKAGQ